MAILYRMKIRRDNINPDDKKVTGYYPTVVRRATIDTKRLAERMANGSTLNKQEARMMIEMMIDAIETELKHGNHVCLNGFGTFSLSAESRLVKRKDEIRAESIRVKRVTFRTSEPFMRRMRKATFEKAPND